MSRLRFVETTGSTNADLLEDEVAVEGDWLIAFSQQAGRGRQGREWVSQSGNFFGSTLVELQPADPPPPSLSIAAGPALIEAVDVAVPRKPLMLKWPNDLLLGGAKLAGVLLERSGDRLVAGFGVNLASAPELEGRAAASLEGAVSPEAFAPLIAGAFARRLAEWRFGGLPGLVAEWLERAHPVGSPLTVHSGARETISGRFAGLEPDGALRLDSADGKQQVIRAGDVEL